MVKNTKEKKQTQEEIKKLFEDSAKIILKSKGKKNYTEIHFTLRSVEFNQPLQVPFRIPGGYKQLTL